MRRFNNIYDKIGAMDNLVLAEANARRNKKGQYGIMVFDRNRQSNLERLRDMLVNKTYRTSRYTTFPVYEPKERIVYAPPYFPDRIVHHAIMIHLERIITPVFTADTYSCIKGKGIHDAVTSLKRALKNVGQTMFCLKIDLKKFYPSINHDILKNLLRKKIKDRSFLELLDEIIDSAVGLPIGNYLSQPFANFYMTYFDHWIKETMGVFNYFRYADDIVILSGSKAYLHKLLSHIRKYLTQILKLTVKENYQVFKVDDRGIDFLGYVFRHGYTRIRKSIKQNFARKLARGANQSTIASYNGWLQWADTKHLQKKLLHEQIQ